MDDIKRLRSELSTMIQTESSKTHRIPEEIMNARKAYQQHSRLNNLKLTGVPEAEREDLYSSVINLAEGLGEPLTKDEIDVINRVPSYAKDSKPIIVRFVSRWKKEEILQKLLTQKRKLTTVDAKLQGPTRPIFINEHLTRQNETLAKGARDLKKTKIILYTWVRNTKVFIKKTENSPPILIKSLKDLEQFKTPACTGRTV